MARSMKTNNLGFLALALLPTLADAGSFTPLWNAGYERIQPTIVSADGLVAVGGTAGGRNLCGGTHAYSWSQQTGIAQLPNPVSTSYNYSCTYASGVSGTGEVIVGYATDGFQNGSSAVKWSSNSAELLPTRPITSISNDGTTIVSSASIGTGSIWTASSGWTLFQHSWGPGKFTLPAYLVTAQLSSVSQKVILAARHFATPMQADTPSWAICRGAR
jgi:hypothetical protein